MSNSPTPSGLIERIMRMVDERIARFARSGFLRNATISAGGLTIKGGFLRVLFPENLGGGLGVYFGDVVSTVTGVYSGTGLLVQDENGRDIAVFRTDAATGRPLALLRDSQGNAVFYTDTTTGQGLARPYIPIPLYPSRHTDWMISTTSSTFETLFRGKGPHQHSKVFLRIWTQNDTPGATGEVKVLVNGQQIGVTETTSTAIVERQFYAPPALANFADLNIEVQARVASGGGALRISPSSVDGRP